MIWLMLFFGGQEEEAKGLPTALRSFA